MHKDFKYMQKLVFGMVAVICLDLGFVAYMSMADSGLSDQASIAVQSETEPDAIAADDFVIERVPSAISEDAVVRRFTPRKVTVDERPIIGKQATKKERVVTTEAAFRPSTTTIFYPVRPLTEHPHAVPATYSQHVVTPDGRQRTEKRSLVAAALPVIKKPFDLIKAIGSKVF